MKVVIAGARGFIGSYLTQFFRGRGDEVVALSRHPRPGESFWDPIERKIDPSALLGADCVINLAGESVMGRWSKKKYFRIRQSRLTATAFLSTTLCKLATPCPLYIGASAIGYYGDRGDEHLTEESPPGHGALATLCQSWERATAELGAKGTRVVLMRLGMVLGDGGALKEMMGPFRLGLGGRLGSGKQGVSWIAIDDVAAAIVHLMQTPALHGPINCVAPHPVTNAELTKSLGRLLHRPTFFTIPAPLLRLLLGAGALVVLASNFVFPKRLLATGFSFAYPTLESALRKYLNRNQ